MILNTPEDLLKWEEINHHILNRVNLGVDKLWQAEILYYKNDQLSVRATFKLQESSQTEPPFSVNLTSYVHMHPDVLRLEFTETKHVGDYATLEEAKTAAQTYFNHHHHTTYTHSH